MDVTGNLFDKAAAPLTITMTDLPPGLTCDPATGTVQGTIAEAHINIHRIKSAFRRATESTAPRPRLFG